MSRESFFKTCTSPLMLIRKALAVSRIPALLIARSTICSLMPGCKHDKDNQAEKFSALLTAIELWHIAFTMFLHLLVDYKIDILLLLLLYMISFKITTIHNNQHIEYMTLFNHKKSNLLFSDV